MHFKMLNWVQNSLWTIHGIQFSKAELFIHTVLLKKNAYNEMSNISAIHNLREPAQSCEIQKTLISEYYFKPKLMLSGGFSLPTIVI